VITLAQYRGLKEQLVQLGWADEIEWASNIELPESPEAFWGEYAWVVINAGMREQIARKIWTKVRPAVMSGRSAHDEFGHRSKADAIDLVWSKRHELHHELQELFTDQAKLIWCDGLPWIGPITKYHLAKNIGLDVAKPDRHLVRLSRDDVQNFCRNLSELSGDRVACVDTVLWRAANLGLI
jgi:hypothetical protein